MTQTSRSKQSIKDVANSLFTKQELDEIWKWAESMSTVLAYANADSQGNKGAGLSGTQEN